MMKSGCKTPHWISNAMVLVGLLGSVGCSSLAKGDPALDMGLKDRGIASWYGKEFHGRIAANGEIFDMKGMTAAHRKLPLGSLVRVVNLTNGKQVQVRINDRGPYMVGRMLDLSYAAAAELGMVDMGMAVVHLEVIAEHRPVSSVIKHFSLSIARIPLQMVHSPSAKDGPLESSQLDYNCPAPTERLFPREMLFVRRERRHTGILAADYTSWNGTPAAATI